MIRLGHNMSQCEPRTLELLVLDSPGANINWRLTGKEIWWQDDCGI